MQNYKIYYFTTKLVIKFFIVYRIIGLGGDMARKIVITSGKGGVGKTSISANLGYKLAVMGKRVCVADLDFGLNNLDVVTGVEHLVLYDIVDGIEGKCRIKQALIQSPECKNLYVLPSAHSFSKSIVTTDSVSEIIDGLSEIFDYILTDCPAGIGGGFHRAVAASDEAIVVTTSQISSLRDADKVIGILKGYNLKRISIVVNMVRGDLVAEKAVASPEKIEDILKTEVIGVIPEDDFVLLRNAGELPPESEANKAFKMLAVNVEKGKNKIYKYMANYTGFLGSIRRGLKRNL